MNHPICRACECVSYCSKHGCIPVQTPEPRLLQDETQTYDSKGLSRWFSTKPNARQEARAVAEEIAGLPVIDPSLIPPKEAQCP